MFFRWHFEHNNNEKRYQRKQISNLNTQQFNNDEQLSSDIKHTNNQSDPAPHHLRNTNYSSSTKKKYDYKMDAKNIQKTVKLMYNITHNIKSNFKEWFIHNSNYDVVNEKSKWEHISSSDLVIDITHDYLNKRYSILPIIATYSCNALNSMYWTLKSSTSDSNYRGIGLHYKLHDRHIKMPTTSFPQQLKRIAIKRNIPNEICTIFNKKMIFLQKTVKDYRYPKKINKLASDIQLLRNRTAHIKLNGYLGNINSSKLIMDENMLLNDSYSDTINHQNEFAKYFIQINDLIDPSLNCWDKKGKWIPTIFNVSKDGNVSIKSDINNLSRIFYANLYSFIGLIFKFMLPMFEWIINVNIRRNNTIYRKYDSLYDKDLKVVIKMQNYYIYPGKSHNYKGEMHRESELDQHIVAVGIYCYDKSDFIQNDLFQISLFDEKIEEKIDIFGGDVLVFNNRNGIQHRLWNITNSSGFDIADRKIISFFLIDPEPGQFVRNTNYVSEKLGKNAKFKKIGTNFNRIYKNIKSSMDILVNINDYECIFIALYWFRKELDVNGLMKRYLPFELIKLIIYYGYNIDIMKQRKARRIAQIKILVPSVQEIIDKLRKPYD